MKHPSSLALESYAVGEPLSRDDAAQLVACAACVAFVGALRESVARGPSATAAASAVAKANGFWALFPCDRGIDYARKLHSTAIGQYSRPCSPTTEATLN